MLAHRRFEAHRGLNLTRIRLNEQAHANPCITELSNNRCQFIVQARGIQPAFSCTLGPALWHDARCMRFVFERNRQHFLRGRHLKIDGQLRARHECIQIGIANMPPVLSQMDSNAIAARLLYNLNRAPRVGMVTAPGISDRRHMVNIDPKA